MAQLSPIEWTDYTSNPIYFVDIRTAKRIWFCVHASEGCRWCYAETMQKRFGGGVDADGNAVKALEFKARNKQFVEAVLNEKELTEILNLNTRLGKKGITAKMFPFDMTDFFLDVITDAMRDRVLAYMALCDNITFQLLTKRAFEMREYFSAPAYKKLLAFLSLCEQLEVNRVFVTDFVQKMKANGWVLPNLWLGTSVEDQPNAEKRIPFLLQTPAAVRFLSVEPLLGQVDLTKLQETRFSAGTNALKGTRHNLFSKETKFSKIDLVIIGGESGSKARPCNINHIRAVVQQCKAAGVPMFVKQLGSVPMMLESDWRKLKVLPLLSGHYSNRKKVPDGFVPLHISGKGGDINEFPEDLRVREFPH